MRRRIANAPPAARNRAPPSPSSASSWTPAVLPPPVGLEPTGTLDICDAISTPHSAGAVPISASFLLAPGSVTPSEFGVVSDAFGALAGLRPCTTMTALLLWIALNVAELIVNVRLY